jgi:hypothetical protein
VPASSVLGEQFSFDPEREEPEVYDHPVVESVLTDTKAYFQGHEGATVESPDEAFLVTNMYGIS